MWTSGSLRHRISSIRIGRSGSARVAAKQPQRSACACFRLRKRFCPVICRSRKTAGFSTCPQTDGAMPACRSFCSRRAYRATSRSIAPGTPSPPPSRCHRGVAIETICKLLGHKNIRTTQIYATLTHAKLANDMELLSERLEKQFAP